MSRLLIVITCGCAIGIGICACMDYRTQADKERDAKIGAAAGDVGSLFGIPRPLVETISGLILLGVGHLNGKRVKRAPKA